MNLVMACASLFLAAVFLRNHLDDVDRAEEDFHEALHDHVEQIVDEKLDGLPAGVNRDPIPAPPGRQPEQ